MNPGYFELRHVVTFQETNLVGNVYYVNYFSWQGRAREMFLRAYAPYVLAELESGRLRLVTAHASCDYVDEFRAFDEVLLRMRLLRFVPFGVSLGFEYLRAEGESATPVLARGRQDIKFLREEGGRWELEEIDPELRRTFQQFEI